MSGRKERKFAQVMVEWWGMLGQGMRQRCALVPGASQLWSLEPGLGISRTGESVPMGGHCDTPYDPTLAEETPGAPPRQPSKGPSHGEHMRQLLWQLDALPEAASGV